MGSLAKRLLLQQKTKWTLDKPNLQPNDLVLIKDENAPPLKWPIGRVIETAPGYDGHVRVVTVKTAEGTVKRAIAKLCKLPLDQTLIIKSSAFKAGENGEAHDN